MTKTSHPKRGTLIKSGKFSTRIHPDNPDHHLWWNRGSWWFHGTVHLPNSTKHRWREGLETKDILTARQRRDTILASGVPERTV